MSEIDARFKKAVWLIRNGPEQDSSNETKLLYYRYIAAAATPPPSQTDPPLKRLQSVLASKGAHSR